MNLKWNEWIGSLDTGKKSLEILTDKVPPNPDMNSKVRYCHFYNRNGCNTPNCSFVHEVAPVCKSYTKHGKCARRLCMYRHEDPADDKKLKTVQMETRLVVPPKAPKNKLVAPTKETKETKKVAMAVQRPETKQQNQDTAENENTAYQSNDSQYYYQQGWYPSNAWIQNGHTQQQSDIANYSQHNQYYPTYPGYNFDQQPTNFTNYSFLPNTYYPSYPFPESAVASNF